MSKKNGKYLRHLPLAFSDMQNWENISTSAPFPSKKLKSTKTKKMKENTDMEFVTMWHLCKTFLGSGKLFKNISKNYPTCEFC